MTHVFDVVVVGGGLAGLAAANRCAENGLSVAVLEAGTEEKYLCNSRLAMGFINVAGRDVDTDPDELLASIEKATAGQADPQLARALADNARNAVAWLRSKGATIIVGNWRPGSSTMLAPPTAIGAGLHWRGRGCDQMLAKLEAALRLNKGRILRGMRALDLILDGRKCIGLLAQSADAQVRFLANYIVIADGGFQANPELLKRYVTPDPGRVLQRNAGTGRGDGLLMAIRAGAKTLRLGGFYGHIQSADALKNTNLWPYPTVDMPISGGITVDREGARFGDEGKGGVYMANLIARQSDPLGTTAIFDHNIWMQRAIEFPIPANPLLAKTGATMFVHDDLDALAMAAGIIPGGLLRTVKDYNAALESDRAQELVPPRSRSVLHAMPIVAPPFYAVPLVAGVTYTTGGIAIDGVARVQHVDGGCIENLFAAGSTTGGHEGGTVEGYTGGLAKALTFGYIAGSEISSRQRYNTAQRPDKLAR